MKTYGLTIKLMAKKPKNLRNCESRAREQGVHRSGYAQRPGLVLGLRRLNETRRPCYPVFFIAFCQRRGRFERPQPAHCRQSLS
jgi:hypothetical protein